MFVGAPANSARWGFGERTWPLSLPNTVRNVIAHELGHVLGLEHNGDATTLMCGRPASCRPVDFASGNARFFPLTAEDERRLTRRWP
ncbi:MAG: matrixin family metalloprotease [Gemmatimonadetes bacterium]|nr:matrixin family metalloprotease [Gemmatimonadota bacterium]